MDIQHIGRYDIKSLIGQGGMSTVYLGYDPRSQREVAIKILPPYYLHSTKFRERFEREALMIALLEHPAIVPVYDMGEEDGQPYIVMRYMSGGSLADKLKKGPIPLRDCVDMYLRLAPALDTAHSRGVTHRDVKPDNLLFDKYDNVFLSDFGLARLRETIGFANISDGSIMGTPAYMSPEQIQGDRAIDGRSDIYSLGVVLYQMLCGSVPYSGTTAASVMMMHLVNPVPQIIERNDTLPAGIQTILDTAMAKKPDDRYQTVGEFARAIQAVTTGVHRKPSDQPTPNMISRRHRTGSTSVTSPLEAIDEPDDDIASIEAETFSNTITPVQGIITEERKPHVLPHDIRKSQSKVHPSSTSNLTSLLRKRLIIPVWGWVLSAVVIILLSLAIILWSLNIFSFPGLPSLLNPDNSHLLDTPAAQATSTVRTPIQSSLVLGKADKLAFLKSSDIWVSSLDGTDLVQLTKDGGNKTNLHWSPDGQSVMYITANCLNLVGLQTHQVLNVTCFVDTPAITAFDISPDGQQIALGLAETNLYLLPYSQLFSLRQSSSTKDLSSLGQCPDNAPYNLGKTLKAVTWSLANNQLAVILSTLISGTYWDEVSILDISQCAAAPLQIEDILPTHFLFTLRGYFNHPDIASLTWGEADQLIMNGYINDGFGDLQLYDLNRHKGQVLAPNGTCCYRDARWSPDGSYLFYAYQPESGGEISLFYIPASKLTKNSEAMVSLALPAGFLTGSKGSLEPALRAAH